MLLYSDIVHTSVSILNCPVLTGYDGKKSMVIYAYVICNICICMYLLCSYVYVNK